MPSDKLSARIAALSPQKRTLLAQHQEASSLAGHTLVAGALHAMGITHVHCVPGAPVYETIAACAAQGLRVIANRHQQASALSAAAQNYVAGKEVAVAIVSSGVAASNALTGVLVARDNCWPLLIVAGAASRDSSYAGQFMALDTPALFRSVTRWAATIGTTADIPAAIARACDFAMDGRPGPVLLELSEDVLGGRSPIGPLLSPAVQAPSLIPDAALDDATSRLLAAKRPLLIVGKGARWAKPFADMKSLVERLGMPFITSPIARGYLSDLHSLCFNAMTWEAQREADLVLIIGARLDWTFRFGTQIAHDADLIHIDIDASELGRNRATRLAIRGDAGVFLRGLLERLNANEANPAMRALDAGWIASLCERRDRVVRSREDDARPRGAHISPDEFARSVNAALPPDALCVFDANLVMAACQRQIVAHAPLTRLTPGSNGCMGVGIPFAIGAKLCDPARPVVAICGDFAFGLHALEMETAIRHNIPIVAIVANNDGNSGALRQRAMFPDGGAEPIATYQPAVAYNRVVEAFGVHSESVTTAAEIGPAVRRALDCGRAACINVPIDPNAEFPFN